MSYFPKVVSRTLQGASSKYTESRVVASAKQLLLAEAEGFADPSFSLSKTFPRSLKNPATGQVLVASHPQAHHDYEAAGFQDQGADIA